MEMGHPQPAQANGGLRAVLLRYLRRQGQRDHEGQAHDRTVRRPPQHFNLYILKKVVNGIEVRIIFQKLEYTYL